MSAAYSDRNLLFGVLALQMDFLDRDALIAALNAWILKKTKSLGDILVEQKILRPDERDALDLLVQKHLDRHHGDIEKSLAAVAVPTPLREELHNLADPDVQASVAHLPATSEADEPGPLPSTVSVARPADGLRYLVLRPHDKGGIGEVFVALDQELNRQVALKEIQERHAADAHSRGRFVREAEITGGLEHPGIVPVYGLGQYADGRPFYAMRFIQGETLKDAIARYHRISTDGSGARSPEFEFRSLLTRFVAVCNTIAYAHSRGVIHRDIKPSNIMLGKYGETLVVDWGMAKAGMNEPAQSVSDGLPEPTLVPSLTDAIETQAGAAMGTPAYMSPEQASGRLDLLGPASDIYSLGATLYTLLTGRPPIEGKETAEVLRKAQRGEWLPPRQVKPEVSPALDAVCCKAMAPGPLDRYTSALALAADVERSLAEEPVSAYREPWAARSRRWMRRHRTLVSTAAVALVIALLSATVGLVFITDAWDKEATARKTADSEKEEARKQKQEAEKQKNEADRRREEALFNEYAAQMNLVQRHYEASNVGWVSELLEGQIPREAGTKDIRNFEWYYWQHMSNLELLTLRGQAQEVNSLSFSPDGQRLASAGAYVSIWDTVSGKELRTLKGHCFGVNGLSFSPDGRRLATAGQDGIVRIWDVITGRELHTLKLQEGQVLGVSFSPDGQRLASAGTSLRVWDAFTKKELLTIDGDTVNFNGVSFSPDGLRLAAISSDQKIRVWNSVTGKELRTFKGDTSNVNSVSFSRDGSLLASANSDQTVRVWNVTLDNYNKELHILKGHTGPVYGVSFGLDGRRLASAGSDQTVRVWDTTTGSEILTIKGHSKEVRGVSYSPDGWRLASSSSDQTIRIWDIAGKEPLPLEGHTGQVFGVSFSSDGRRLASASLDKTVRIWDTAFGKGLFTLEGHTGVVFGVSFSPDGRRVASASDDETVRVWDATIGKKLLTLKGHTDSVNGVSFSPDGLRLASSSSDKTVRVWDTVLGKESLILNGHEDRVVGVSFSPDGRRLASASSDQTVRIWDVASGKVLFTLEGHTGPVSCVAFDPDGRRLASASSDQTVRVWDATIGKELLTLKGHTDSVNGVSFSADGMRLASTSSDKTVRVWDAVYGKEVLTLKGLTGPFWGVTFSPDGQRLASAGDNMVQVWAASPVSDELRQKRAWLVNHVHSVFADLVFAQEVLDDLRKDPNLGDAEREFAIQVAARHPENPVQLNEAARKVVKACDEGLEAYARALRRADAAARLDPHNGRFLNTLGVALYRAGRYTDALPTLAKSEKLNATKQSSLPADLAFLAMTQHQLGKKDEAKSTLGRLWKVMKQPRWSQDAESVGFLREAEELIEGKPASKKK